MNPWLFRISLSHLTQHPGRSLLGVLGIALGTAVYLSIALAANQALQSFQSGVTAVAGKAQWRLQSPGAPLDENIYPQVRRLPEVKAAAPVVESILELSAPLQGPVLLLGIDPFSERPLRDYQISPEADSSQTWRDFFLRPDAVLISRKLADRLGLKPGDSLPVMVGGSRHTLKIVGVFSSPRGLYPLDGSVILMDLAPAQELLDRVGRLDYIDVLGRGDPRILLPGLQALAPPGVEVANPGAASRQMEGLVASYRLNLAVLSAIALFVGMFLIYQSVTLSVVRRRREIGLLRTLGMTSRQVLLLFLAEGLASGLAGGLGGLLLGVALAQGVLGVMTQNLTSLYTPVVAQEAGVSAGLLFQAWALAVGATLAAALLPAREAARTRVRAVWHREELEEKIETRAGAIFLAGVAALALAGALACWKVQAGPPYPGFIAAFLILLAFALFTPLATRILGRRLQPVFRAVLGPAGNLGCRYLSGSLSRSAVSIAALACALGMLIAVVVMIGSFRQTVNNWVTRSISGDIFFGPAVFSTSAYDHFLPPEILPELRRDPDVRDIYLYRCVRLPFKDRYVLAIGGSFDVLARHGGLWFRKGNGKEIMMSVGGGGQGQMAPAPASKVIISEALAETFGIKEGDTLQLPTPAGVQPLTVAGVFYDYRTDGPSVWMDISLFRRFWPDHHLNAVRLYLKEPGRVGEVQARLQETYGSRYRLLTLSHGELRAGILKIFDETFALTYALEGVAVLVAVFGIITTFMVLIMERERELALLQTIGASRGQILGMVLVESGLASLLSFTLGAGAGSVLSLLLILVINKQAFGWTIHLHWVPGIYLQTLVLVLALGLTAAAYPAWRAFKTHPAAILKEE
ncbi:MAG: ABC transporter permease [Deltaproteobacteria bacterium]|nr:ABC transporter permease [Deltaproteobacteria bacterium]